MLKLSKPLTLLLASLTYILGASISAYLGEESNNFRLGLGRKNLPQAVERLEDYISNRE